MVWNNTQEISVIMKRKFKISTLKSNHGYETSEG